MQDQEKYKHKVRVSRRNWYIRFFCWAWDTRPERLDICKLIWGTLAMPILPIVWMVSRPFVFVAWVFKSWRIELRDQGRIRGAFRDLYDVRYGAKVPAPVYGGGVVVMTVLIVVFSPAILAIIGFENVRDRIRDWRRNRVHRSRRVMTEANLERITGRASETTARRVNLFKTIWFALPEPVRKALKWPWSIIRLPVLAVKAIAKGAWSVARSVWRQIARVPLWIYGIVGLIAVSITLAAVFDFPAILAILIAFGTVGSIWLVIHLFSKYRVIARIKEGGKTFGQTIASYGRGLKYNTCPQIVVKD